MSKQNNPIDVDVQCKRRLLNIENNIDKMIICIQSTNKIITAWIADPVENGG